MIIRRLSSREILLISGFLLTCSIVVYNQGGYHDALSPIASIKNESEEFPQNNLGWIDDGTSRTGSTTTYFPPFRELENDDSNDDDDDDDDDSLRHKALFPLSVRDMIGFSVAAIGLMISAVGGIGGGGILIPIFILIMDFSPKLAIPLSSISILGGALANSIFNFRKRHPLVDRPLIDWDLILVMEPLTIAGALIGAILNKVLPEFFIIVMLVLLLSFTANKTIRKGIQLHKEEQQQITTYSKIKNGRSSPKQMSMLSALDDNDSDSDNKYDPNITVKRNTNDTKTTIDDLESIVKDNQTEQIMDGEGIEMKSFNASDSQLTSKHKQALDHTTSNANDKELQEETNDNNTATNITKNNNNSHNESTDTACLEKADKEKDSYSFQVMDDFIAELDEEQDEEIRCMEQCDLSERESNTSRSSLSLVNEVDLQKIMEEERKTPYSNVISLTVMFVAILIVNTIKGGGKLESPLGIQCGSTSFWFANMFMIVWLVLFSVGARFHLLKRHLCKVNAGYDFLDCDIQWDERTTIIFPSICCLAGFFAGMFGVGGGIIKGPLMLAMGVNAKVSSATSACMILFTSSTTTISFTVFGLLKYDYAMACLFIGFFFTLLVHILVGKKFTHKDSYIAFSIGGVVLLSAILMGIQSIITVVKEQQNISNTTTTTTDRLCSGTSD